MVDPHATLLSLGVAGRRSAYSGADGRGEAIERRGRELPAVATERGKHASTQSLGYLQLHAMSTTSAVADVRGLEAGEYGVLADFESPIP